jgi:hypothetical protein
MSEPSPPSPQGQDLRNLPRPLRLHPLALGAVAVGLAAVAVLAVADRAEAQAMINNGVIELGVDATGQLNICCGAPSSGTGTPFVGLRYLPTGAEATAPGCLCEGWGVSYDGAVSGYANNAVGSAGLALNSFVGVNGGLTAVVDVNAGDLNVVHDYHPAAGTADLYEATVTITNQGAVAHNNVEYRRVMDWDVEPTAFSEHVTIDDSGAAPAPLQFSSNDGFASADPLTPWTNLGFVGPGTGAPFFDAGPADHGALFEFDFGTLAPGASVTFNIYYGAARDEATAYADLASVGATLYSFGQPSSPGGPNLGQPNTFIFAFGGGALAVAPPLCEAHAVLVRETDLSGALGDAVVPLVSSTATATPAPGMYAFSPFGPIPAPDAHADAELAEASYTNGLLGVSASARVVGSWCDALAVDVPGVFTEAFGQVELADISLALPGFALTADAGVFEAKAWGFPGGTFAAWNCDLTSGFVNPPALAWTAPCPGPNFVIALLPGVTLTLNEQLGPVAMGGQDVYTGALAHLQVVVPGVTQLDVYIGYVQVAATP